MGSLHYRLMKAHVLLQREILLRAGEIGLTPGQPKVLEYLHTAKEADQKTIAANCEIEPATVGSILLRMEKAGLVSRRQKGDDRRSLYVSLTKEGEEAAEKTMAIFQTTDELASATLTEEEREKLNELLEKVGLSLERLFEERKSTK